MIKSNGYIFFQLSCCCSRALFSIYICIIECISKKIVEAFWQVLLLIEESYKCVFFFKRTFFEQTILHALTKALWWITLVFSLLRTFSCVVSLYWRLWCLGKKLEFLARRLLRAVADLVNVYMLIALDLIVAYRCIHYNLNWINNVIPWLTLASVS